ncbi:MAG: Gfo/Idh/MocA family oxidoreductase [Gemmatimonadetes bacterium]|nr:Gfo/Idh/MocA family oxidoreductase [Gemmatimonadota bacterium]
MTKPTRIGVIGMGAVAQVAHLPALASHDNVEIVGVCDIDMPKARALAARFDIRDTYDDIENLLRIGRPDAVVICTPNHLHQIYVETALSAGVAVLCERPLALTAAGVEQIIAAQARAGHPVIVGMNHRYRTEVQAVRGFVLGGELGSLRGIRAGWYQFRPARAELGWRQRLAQAGGGAMLDLGLAVLDLSIWLADKPTPIEVTASLQGPADSELEDAGCALVRCENDFTIFVDVAWRYVGDQERFWVDVMGEDGSARVSPLRVFKELHGAPVNVTPSGASGRENPFATSYRAEWATFLAAVRGEVQAPSIDDQVLLHRTIEAIYRSAKEGRAVAV